METRPPTLGVEAQRGQSLVDELDALERTLKESLAFDSAQSASFYEILANALVWTKGDALAILKNLGGAERAAVRFSDMTGWGLAADVSFRFVPVAGEMHSENWWDVHIEPSFRSPHQCYRATIVFRDEQREKVMRVASNIEQNLTEWTTLLEEPNE